MSFIFDGNEDPRVREARQRQQQMSSLQASASQTPQNVGQGMSAIANALAYRSLDQKQKAAANDPWAGMRQAGGMSSFGSALKGLFGLGAS